MINQPDPVYSYTIPYFNSNDGETDELFVSLKTYEKYLKVLQKDKLYILSGKIHPLGSEYGDVTSTLFDPQKAIIIIGIKDIEEYTSELLDIAIAQELEKVYLIHKETYFRFLYSDHLKEHLKLFIDDIQQTLEEIHVAKRLKNEGYRISERETLIANELLQSSVQWKNLKSISPFETEQGLFLLTKLFYLAYVDDQLYTQCKKQLLKKYPLLFMKVDELLHATKKINISTLKGREKALMKLFTLLGYKKYVKKVKINEIKPFNLDLV